MQYIYLKPQLKNLSQGERIAFVRQFRRMTQDEVSDKLGLDGENKRRSMVRYESGDRKPKENRLLEIAKILDVNKKYEIFIKYLFDHYDKRDHSIEVCIYRFKKQYLGAKCVSAKQVYNWIEQGKIFLKRTDLCNKKHKKKKRSGMMERFILPFTSYQ